MGRKSKKDVSRIIWAQLPVCRRIRCLIVEELTNVKSCQEIKLTQLLQDVENSEHDVTTTLTRLKLVAAYISENLQQPLPNVAVNVLIKYFIISTPQPPIRGVLASILETTTHYNDGSMVFTTFANTLEEYLDLTAQEFDIEENRHVIELLNACVGMTLGLRSIQVHIGKVIYFLKLFLDKLLSLGDVYQQPGSTECDIAALLKCNTQILKRLHSSNNTTLFTVEDTENLTQVMLNCRHISAKEEFGWDCCSAASMTLLVIWQAMYASPELLKKVKDTLSNFATENSCCTRTCLSFCNGTMVSVDWNMLVMSISNVEDGPYENLLLQYIFPLLRNTKERCKTISDRVIVAKCFVHWTSIALKASKQCALEFEQWFMISTIGNSEMENLISYALEELEHPTDAIRHQANEMLVNLLNIASNISHEDFSSGLVTTTMSQNWQKRSTFTALKCILDHVSPDKVLQQNGDILNKLLHAMHHQSLAPYSSQAYVTLASKCGKSMETVDLSTSLHQLNTFMKPLLKTMCKCPTNSLRLLIDYPFVKLLKIYKEDCIEYIFTYFKQELDCGGQFSFSNAQTLAAFLSCMKCTVANGLLKNHNIATHDTAINNLIQSSLVHENHDIRHLGFALLCESMKPSNLIAPSVLDSIKSALPFNFLCQDPAFRQRLLCSLKKLLLQIDGNISHVMKAQKPGKNSDARQEDGLLCTYCNFVSWICEFALSQLYPSAPYPKRVTCISIVCLVVDIFIKNTGKHWKFQPSTVFTPETIHSLTVLLSDPYDDVTHLSFTVLANEQLRNTVLSALSPDWLENLYTTSLDRAYKCGKPEWCGDTACRLKLYCVLLSSETGPSHNQILTRVCSKLLSLLNESISKANRNLYLAANCSPMYGLLHCIRILLKCINFSILDSGSLVEWRHIISSLVTACFQVASAVLPVVGSVSPEGHLPDIGKSSSDEVDGGLDDAWNELPDAIKSLVIGENSLDDQDERKTRAFAQQILVCCWRSAKESSLLLQEISTSRFPLDSSSSVSDGVLSWDQLLRIGEHLRKQLMEARHRGAFEIAYYAFKAYCPRLWNIYHRELSKIPVEWLDSILLDVQDPVRSKNFCATRRSAGLPFCMQALLSGNKTTQGRKHLHHAMLLLLSLCEVSDTEGLLPKVHSLNIIRGLVKDASLGEEILPYVSQCLQVALTGFNSSIWAVRNSSTLLFSALFTRVFGVKHDKDDYLSLKNRLSGNEFFSLLPGLHSFLVKQFQVICDLLKKGSHYALSPSLHPILLLLSRVYPSTMQSTSETSLHVFIPLLIECRASAVYKTRIAASHALASILNWNQSVEVLENCTKNLKDDVDIARGLKKEMTNVNSSPQNRIHGGLLQIKEIVLASERQHDHHFVERFEAIMKIVSCVYEHVLPFLVSKLNNCPLTAATSLDLFLCIENRRAKITNKRSDNHSWKKCFEMCMRSSIKELRDSDVSRSHVPGYTFLLDTAAEVTISLEERAENITSLMTHLIEFGEFNALRSLMKSLLSLWPQMTNKFAYQDLHIRLEELLSNAILTKSYSDEIAELIYRLLTEVASSASAETLLVQATERSINCNPSQASYMEALLNFQSKCVGIIIRNNSFGSLSDIIGPWICVLSAASQPHENTDDVRLAVSDSLVANTSLLFADGKNRLGNKVVDMWMILFHLLSDEEYNIRKVASHVVHKATTEFGDGTFSSDHPCVDTLALRNAIMTFIWTHGTRHPVECDRALTELARSKPHPASFPNEVSDADSKSQSSSEDLPVLFERSEANTYLDSAEVSRLAKLGLNILQDLNSEGVMCEPEQMKLVFGC